MNPVRSLSIAASGMTAERIRLETVASNLANARTTRTEDGGPYRRRSPVFRAGGFDGALGRELARVEVAGIVESDEPPVMVYDPGHPDADENGYVAYPNVNVLEEMVDLMTTARSFEANTNVVTVTGQMVRAALEIGR